MKKMLKKIINKQSSDSGDGNLVAAFLIIPLFIGLGLIAIDSGMFFYNYSQIQNIARDGAYNVASVGGVGSPTGITDLEAAYFRTVTRTMLNERPPGWNAANGRNLTVRNSMEYMILDTLAASNLYNVDITNVRCAVDNSSNGGAVNGNYVRNINTDRPFCRIDWTHSYLGYSLLGVFVDHSNRSTIVNVPAEVQLGVWQQETQSRPH